MEISDFFVQEQDQAIFLTRVVCVCAHSQNARFSSRVSDFFARFLVQM
jgi:hypothetical protein